MNSARFRSIYNGLTSLSQKVYEATPINENWTPAQVCAEMARSGPSRDMRHVVHCLNAMKEAGIVLEPSIQHFTRAPVRGKYETPAPLPIPNQDNVVTLLTAQPKPISPIDKLTQLSGRVTGMMNALKELAVDIDDAAMEIEEQMVAKDAQSTKLKQLQTLLKELT